AAAVAMPHLPCWKGSSPPGSSGTRTPSPSATPARSTDPSPTSCEGRSRRSRVRVDRRDFIKLSCATVGALAVGNTAEAQLFPDGFPNPFRPPPGAWYSQDVTTVFSYCENCFWKCGIKAYVAGGKVRKVDGYEGNPKSRGMLCPRGQGAPAQTYDPDRLKKPLIRVEGTERGDGQYREASWDEALDYIAEKMFAIRDTYGKIGRAA